MTHHDRHVPHLTAPRLAFDPIHAALRRMTHDVEREEVPAELTELVALFAARKSGPTR